MAVLIDITFNLGSDGVYKFAKMWEALKNNNYQDASRKLLDSKYARQSLTKYRALRNADALRNQIMPVYDDSD